MAYLRRADLDGDGRISGAEAVASFQGTNLPKLDLAQGDGTTKSVRRKASARRKKFPSTTVKRQKQKKVEQEREEEEDEEEEEEDEKEQDKGEEDNKVEEEEEEENNGARNKGKDQKQSYCQYKCNMIMSAANAVAGLDECSSSS
ncbi:glutamic acid-rich protein-like [Rosa chinensis]|uniref:glutamic acid-rich protein-like n=1 Tax=Rosa chinensis TaxID=74649 RepID=UPI000D093CDB|nr:glutamic acid-rich protein-like [Rosa chinensis]